MSNIEYGLYDNRENADKPWIIHAPGASLAFAIEGRVTKYAGIYFLELLPSRFNDYYWARVGEEVPNEGHVRALIDAREVLCNKIDGTQYDSLVVLLPHKLIR